MISARADRSSAVRRAAGSAGLTASLFTVLVLAELPSSLLDGPGAGSGVRRAVAVLLVAVTLLPVATLVPVGVHVLAHPRRTGLPANSAAAALAGARISLFCLAGGFGVLLARWATGGGPVHGAPVAVRVGTAVTAVTALGSGLVAAVRLRRLHASAGTREAAGPHRSARPDLLDDLATLSARALPGSAPARVAATLNRTVDTWAHGPRRRRAASGDRPRGAVATAVTRIAGTRPQPF